MKKISLLLCLFLLSSFFSATQAQYRKQNSRGTRSGAWNDNFYGIFKFTVGAGVVSYKGDLGGPPKERLRPIRPNLYLG
ncbi:MAG: hypothetical protein H7Y04_12885, partial [Verrucomicrobia bacterium]|nr:hypothetical protein [Cytophagales bacterium]